MFLLDGTAAGLDQAEEQAGARFARPSARGEVEGTCHVGRLGGLVAGSAGRHPQGTTEEEVTHRFSRCLRAE
ncbi:MAG: hypothetical protein ACRCZP_19245, partial [Phycicoccus sp.]